MNYKESRQRAATGKCWSNQDPIEISSKNGFIAIFEITLDSNCAFSVFGIRDLWVSIWVSMIEQVSKTRFAELEAVKSKFLSWI